MALSNPVASSVKSKPGNAIWQSEGFKAFGLFLLSLATFLLFWEVGARSGLFAKGMPTASKTLQELWWWTTHPFFDNGPNDLGIGWNLLISLRRVAIGYVLASIVAIPLGILIGISPVAYRAFNPYVQLLKPVSPLAWLPLGLYILRDSEQTGIFIIFIYKDYALPRGLTKVNYACLCT